MPFLDTPDDIHGQLPVLPQRVVPVFRNRLAERQIPRHAADHHLPHRVILARVRVDVLHPPQAGVRLVVMVPRPDRLDHIVPQLLDFELLRQEVEVQQGADFFLFDGVAQSARVEPADEELEGGVVGVGQAVGLGGGGFRGGFVVEDVGEEGGVVAEELFVQDPLGGVGRDVDVDHGVGEEPEGWKGC